MDKSFRKLTIRVCVTTNLRDRWRGKVIVPFFIILKMNINKNICFYSSQVRLSTANTIIFTDLPRQYKNESISSSPLFRNYSIHFAYVFEQSFICMVIRFVNAPSRSCLYVHVRIP